MRHGDVEAEAQLAHERRHGQLELIFGHGLGSVQAVKQGVRTEAGSGMTAEVGNGVGKEIPTAGIHFARQLAEPAFQSAGTAPRCCNFIFYIIKPILRVLDMKKNEKNKDMMYKIIQDVYEYIIKIAPLLLCLGFVLFLIQKTVRFAYYEVDHLYLMEIRSEEVLQSLSYLFIFIYIFFFLHDYKSYYNENKKINVVFIFTQLIVVFLYILFLWYTQTYYINFLNIISIFIIIFVLSVATLTAKYILSIQNNKRLSRIKICFIIFLLIAAIAIIQYAIESSNKRFTYLENGGKQYNY